MDTKGKKKDKARTDASLQASYPNDMMHTVDVTVPDVNPDGPEGEAVLLSGAMNGNGGAQHADSWEEVSAG